MDVLHETGKGGGNYYNYVNPFSASLIYMRKPQSTSLDLQVKKRKKKFYSDRSIDVSLYDIELN